jgi:hypothetical protein
MGDSYARERARGCVRFELLGRERGKRMVWEATDVKAKMAKP